jgi:hypothetical protein
MMHAPVLIGFGTILAAAGVVLTPSANAAPPDVENRPGTVVDLDARLGINPYTQVGYVSEAATYTGL